MMFVVYPRHILLNYDKGHTKLFTWSTCTFASNLSQSITGPTTGLDGGLAPGEESAECSLSDPELDMISSMTVHQTRIFLYKNILKIPSHIGIGHILVDVQDFW